MISYLMGEKTKREHVTKGKRQTLGLIKPQIFLVLYDDDEDHHDGDVDDDHHDDVGLIMIMMIILVSSRRISFS